MFWLSEIVIPHLKTLFCPIASVAVLTPEWFLSVGFVTARQDVRLEVALGGWDVDALRTVPALAAPGHLDVGQGVIVLAGAQRMELISRAQQSLHHDGIGRRGVGGVLSQELHQSWRENNMMRMDCWREQSGNGEIRNDDMKENFLTTNSIFDKVDVKWNSPTLMLAGGVRERMFDMLRWNSVLMKLLIFMSIKEMRLESGSSRGRKIFFRKTRAWPPTSFLLAQQKQLIFVLGKTSSNQNANEQNEKKNF